MSWVVRILADPFDTARALARAHNLVCDNGQIVCWNCKRHEALMPSLHCAPCLGEAWRRLNIHDPRCEQREQTDEDKRLMAQPGEQK